MKNLLGQMAGIDLGSVVCSSTKVSEGETPVGTMSDDLKRLYHLRCRIIGICEALEKPIKAKYDACPGFDNEEQCEAFRADIQEQLNKISPQRMEAAAINELFWGWVKFEFPEVCSKPNIAVREDYTVVWTESDCEEVPFCVVVI